MRIVLAAEHNDDWRAYRQPRWMGLVRDRPEASGWPRRHFDLPDAAAAVLLDRWDRDGLGRSVDSALAALIEAGATEIVGPSERFGPTLAVPGPREQGVLPRQHVWIGPGGDRAMATTQAR